MDQVIQSLDWSSWVTAIATVFLAALTGVYIWLTKKIIATQTNPCVILSVLPDENNGKVLLLVARNIGTGIAYDVRFEFSRPMHMYAFGTKRDATQAEEMKEGPLIDGIPALGPGETRKLYWGQFGGLEAVLGDSPIIATCRFRNSIKEMPPVRCPLEVSSFGITVSADSPIARIAKELENISQKIDHLVSELHAQKVVVVSMPKKKSEEGDE